MVNCKVKTIYDMNHDQAALFDGYSLFRLENNTGTGEIFVYDVFPGIQVAYNDIHMEYCNKNQTSQSGMLEINYCREGRYECDMGRGSYCYMSAGDFAIGSLAHPVKQACFPNAHYHGISIFLDMNALSAETEDLLNIFSVDLSTINAMAEKMRHRLILRGSPEIDHIFSELYSVKESRKDGHLKVKVLELLLFLGDLNIEQILQPSIYLSSKQVALAKAVKQQITENIRRHITIEELAFLHKVSPTVLKESFKCVYGTSVYAYLRILRLQVAQKLLRETKNTIAEIAACVGYENPNKFATAFKKEFGLSPTDFRKSVPLDR